MIQIRCCNEKFDHPKLKIWQNARQEGTKGAKVLDAFVRKLLWHLMTSLNKHSSNIGEHVEISGEFIRRTMEKLSKKIQMFRNELK